ncbi:Pkinase domain-containing protein/B_lectin domain-containing protein/PAN_2 domain-containing protein [Cephalotus follicularis]|uniref:Receptor-like serine/threonine-protein kinase n=1 Tax=Cephalotus follicularis TaxID=3775 RepID=A0A1Q3CMR9_CEPFO|nr:Pkinase domain-containing protein/B_lectin domain-containing protein/PAN_2 domain-containing protein [Cephalotus follicularis]
MEWIDHEGLFLLSTLSVFGLRFYTSVDDRYFLLVVIHNYSRKVVWTANRGLLVSSSDKFVLDKNGNAYLTQGNGKVWSTDTEGEKVTSMELRDSGNLVLLGENGSTLWQSFSHPTDTLLSGQEFTQGMRLKSFHNDNNLSVYLELKPDDLILYAGYDTPQQYWSLANDSRKTNNSVNGKVHSASLASNAWNFYDQNDVLLWQFIFSNSSDPNATWTAVLGSRGEISFYNLQEGETVTAEAMKIPENSCRTPEFCNRYEVCFFDNMCQCPTPLISQFNCKPPVVSTCNMSANSGELFYVGEKLDYFAIDFVLPISKSSLDACKEACLSNCSCLVFFFDNSTGSCFMFEEMGSYLRSEEGTAGYVSFLKVSTSGIDGNTANEGRGKHAMVIVLILVATVVVIVGLVYVGILYHRRHRRLLEFSQENLEEDNFLDSLPGTPVRFSYNDLCKATKNFTTKVGQGGFGSVYLGVQPDGTRLAIKKLEGVGQGKKEFRSEVCIIGGIHHVHLVKLKGFCAEGIHRLLVYEYLANGSLDKWIFKNNEESLFLDWNTRFNIALGTAKGLAYLHEECEVKIVHCDIKPENVLLDDSFTAKVSDFGLAKLMNREDSLVYTTLRGTRGYLAPEWITSNPISEKSDVYSYGLVLLEIIGGRKNYDPGESSEKVYFPSYAFKMSEEGTLKEILDPKLDIDENDERVVTAIRVALWCIQDEMRWRPRMTQVVQMLEGLAVVPQPPTSSQLISARAYSSFAKWSSEAGTSSGTVGFNSDAPSSGIRLSGPR